MEPPPSPPPSLAGDQLVLWTTIWGSHLWGMAGPASDTDTCTVYLLDPETRARYQFGSRVESDWSPGSDYRVSHEGAPRPLIDG